MDNISHETNHRALEQVLCTNLQQLNCNERTKDAPQGPLFSKLPSELRRQVWLEVLTPYLKPRVHAIKLTGKNKFKSNQPLSPLLRICQETRNFYFEKTSTEPGFGTYVNFDIDTLYFLYDPNINANFTSSLKETPGHEKIQKLALAKENILVMREGSSFPGDVAKMDWDKILRPITNLKEVTVIFLDTRSPERAWSDYGISLSVVRRSEKGSWSLYSGRFLKIFTGEGGQKYLLAQAYVEIILVDVKDDLDMPFCIGLVLLPTRLLSDMRKER